MQMVHITLHPGELLKLHATPIDVFYVHSKGAVSLRSAASEGRSWQIGSSRASHEFRTVCRM